VDAAGDIVAGIADTSALSDPAAGSELIEAFYNTQFVSESDNGQDDSEFSVLVVDGNTTAEVFDRVLQHAVQGCTAVLFEPTSVQKSVLPIELDVLHHITIITPNLEVSACTLHVQHKTAHTD
jgi:hypothetical protein